VEINTNFQIKHFSFCKDRPEDVLGGLNKTLSLNWAADSGTKLIFHTCDYPAHGKLFYAGEDDRYPNGDPTGLTHTQLFEQFRKRQIQYCFGSITSHTDQMLEQFNCVCYAPISQFNVEDAGNICESVVAAIRESMCTSTKDVTTTSIRRTPRTFEYDKSEPNWNAIEHSFGSFVTYKAPGSIIDVINDVPLIRNHSEVAKVKIAPKPFAHGE
jgi:hypothetical protein